MLVFSSFLIPCDNHAQPSRAIEPGSHYIVVVQSCYPSISSTSHLLNRTNGLLYVTNGSYGTTASVVPIEIDQRCDAAWGLYTRSSTVSCSGISSFHSEPVRSFRRSCILAFHSSVRR